MDNIEIKVVREPESLESILELNPTTTIIIGGEVDVYKSCGFYYSFNTSADSDSIIKEYTEKINAVGVAECYEIHQAMYHEEVLRADKETCSANSVLHSLLDAFKVHDYSEVARILQFNLEYLEDNAERLQNLYSSLAKDNTFEVKAVNYKQKLTSLTADYNVLAEEVTSLRKYSDSVRELEFAKIQIQDDNDKIADLTAKLSAAELELKQACSKKDYDSIKEKLDYAEAQVKYFQNISAHRAETTSEFDKKEDSTSKVKDDIIRDLKASLAELTAKQQSNVSPNESLPIIDANIGLRAKRLFNIKEIRRAVYTTALVEFLAIRSKTAKVKDAGYNTIIVIYDNLNDYNIDLYKQLGFCINSPYSPENGDTYPVVVTDILTKTFLINTINIASYNYVIIVDRLGYSKMVVNRIDAVNYYLINSSSDIDLYNLKPEECFCYYDSKGTCLYNIIPSETYNSSDYRIRVANFTSNVGNPDKRINNIFQI